MANKDTSAAAAAQEAAQEAATLVKTTAETTAAALALFTSENTKLALNIQYIQRDLAELKADFKDSKLKYIDVNAHQELCKNDADKEVRIRDLEKFQQNWLGKVSVIGVVASIVVSAIFVLIQNLIK